MIFILSVAFVMRIASRMKSLLISVCAMVFIFFITVSANDTSSIDVIVNKVDSYYQTISKKIDKTKIAWLRKRLRLNTEKAYARFIDTLPDGDQKLIVQTLLTRIQQRTQQEIIPTQDLVLIRQVINATNSDRKSIWSSPLAFNYKLTMVAYRHARDLRDHFPYDTNGDGMKETISHVGSDASTVKERADDIWYDWISLSENIAYNQTTVEEVMTDRMASPHHQENILSETVNEMGVAKVGPYWVQVFGKRRENK